MSKNGIDRMTPAEYEQALAQLGLSQRRAAIHLFGMNERTSRFYVSGKRPVPPLVARFLRYLIATKKTGEYAIKKLEG